MAQNILTRTGYRWVGVDVLGGGIGDDLIPDRSQSVPPRRKVENVITGLAHTGVCVPDCEAAVAFYRDVLGLRVLSPPYVMAGNAIRDDMGELVSDPTMKAAIVGFGDDSDRVLEVIEYVNVDGGDQRTAAALTDHGLSHVGLICEDLDATRAELESKGVRFLVSGIADVARVRTTWFVDPWGVVFILVEKSRPERPYFAQWS
jgi:predicted enzyme related to lactoylglutathione lyase